MVYIIFDLFLADNPNSTFIKFRTPNDTIIQRRFNKTDKLICLYHYLDSLDERFLLEGQDYEIIESFPFKLYSRDLECSLEELKLYPNAVLTIKEL